MYIVFNVLPFGISTAGYMFTKVLRVVLKWRYMGFKVVLCLDDGRGGEHGFERALCSSLYIQKYLLTFGFSTAYAKCRLDAKFNKHLVRIKLELGRRYAKGYR